MMKIYKTLEFDKIINRVTEYALSEEAKKQLQALQPLKALDVIDAHLNEVTEGRRLADSSFRIPVNSLEGVKALMDKIEKGRVMDPVDLNHLAKFLSAGEKMVQFMSDKESLIPVISQYASSISVFEELYERLISSVVGTELADQASTALHKIRKRMSILSERIQGKLQQFLRSSSSRDYIQDSVIAMRNGKYVLSIKSTAQNLVRGHVLDKSHTGSTVFMELDSTRKLQDEIDMLKIKENEEVYRILAEITNEVAAYMPALRINYDCLVQYDFIYAKAKYSKAIQGTAIELNNRGDIQIIKGRHPLLGSGAVPLNLCIPKNKQGLLITGPNTGGKTVTLKTVGLLTLMTQCGLHGSAAAGTKLINFSKILADIGDGQDLEQSLSTFSAHITNIISIMEQADKHSLVILDEVGTGTDPIEGMGLAIALLKNLYNKGSKILATTHFSELKSFALHHDGFENGSMAFDLNTLKPKYELVMGESGASNAFLIALRLGLSQDIIEEAHEISYEEKKNYSGLLEERLEADRKPIVIEKPEEVVLDRKPKKEVRRHDFSVGDLVYVPLLKQRGVIVELEDRKGDITVMIKKKKTKINYKRLKKYIDKKELYPDGYDMDIVTKSKGERKTGKQIKKGKRGVVLEHSSS